MKPMKAIKMNRPSQWLAVRHLSHPVLTATLNSDRVLNTYVYGLVKKA